ncbi:5-formyltetrahydrofolate cyclo-ligase [Thiomicrorhabdus sp. ZW0627]|uniref:5-formyltetrahydrofolate cyclo-ligase n=1 Tax=Thiomicrorhabdus sp. ZW0627 TaxID=3039774 RepID=UPI002436C260|nr:5-formyltetrahydrofolate cyclo-ligase [Thiomicrorhabdus sp. ZW0627]MDG6773232.1 5-formyltetrahydrofolate cyclo-ligase [Thiomicrorhabdus sp. ZW0627]
MTIQSSATLRKTLREKRQTLTTQQQNEHALSACQNLLNSKLLQQNKKIAVFLSQDGELGTEPLIHALWEKQNLEVYLPALETQPNWHMGFSPYLPGSRMIPNRFKIPEPDIPLEQHLSGVDMDLVIMPLVGFDGDGNRMGMGGGYYDRTFEFKLKEHKQKPLLIGWAHSCQQVQKLDTESWDVPLDAIVTELGLLSFNK